MLTETLGIGTAGNVNINTKRLILQDGAQVSSSTFSQGNGGQITVKASESVQATGWIVNEKGNVELVADQPIHIAMCDDNDDIQAN